MFVSGLRKTCVFLKKLTHMFVFFEKKRFFVVFFKETGFCSKPLPHHLCSLTSSLCACHVSSASIECIFSTYVLYGPTSETVWMQKRQKDWLKYTDFTELKMITSRIYSNCSNYSSLFFKSFKFRCCSFCLTKKM